MARRLQIDELASEAGASVELIERLTEIGVLRPQPDGWYGAGDLIRLEALNAFLDASSLEMSNADNTKLAELVNANRRHA